MLHLEKLKHECKKLQATLFYAITIYYYAAGHHIGPNDESLVTWHLNKYYYKII